MKHKFLYTLRNLIFIGLTIGWAVLIFLLSAENRDASSLRNEEITENLKPYYYSALVEAGDKLESAFHIQIEDVVNTFIRKSAHIAVYAVLGFLGMLAMCAVRCNLFTRVVATSNFCLLYAIGDELHQMFVPGRSCSVLDVCFDYVGSLGGIIAFCLLLGLWRVLQKWLSGRGKRTSEAVAGNVMNQDNQQIFHSYKEE